LGCTKPEPPEPLCCGRGFDPRSRKDVEGKHTVAAYSISTSARTKIEAAGGKVVTIPDLMKKNPEGKGVYILG
jgi:ribosomal protein L18E